jgi:hypothetical protein
MFLVIWLLVIVVWTMPVQRVGVNVAPRSATDVVDDSSGLEMSPDIQGTSADDSAQAEQDRTYGTFGSSSSRPEGTIVVDDAATSTATAGTD